MKFSIDYLNKLSEKKFKFDKVIIPKLISHESKIFLTREKLDRTLTDAIRNSLIPFDSREREYMAFQLCFQITSLHQIHQFHGDLKPSNIFLSSSLKVQITDPAPFKPFHLSSDQVNFYRHFFTTKNNDGHYLAPERFSNKTSKVKLYLSDLYSLGLVIYFIFSNGQHLIQSINEFGKDFSSKIDLIEPPNIRKLLTRLLDPSPKNRKLNNTQMKNYFHENLKIFSEFCRSLDTKQYLDVSLDTPHLTEVVTNYSSEDQLLYFNLVETKLLSCPTTESFFSYLKIYLALGLKMNQQIIIYRLIPSILSLLSFKFFVSKVSSIYSFVLNGFLIVLQNIESIPPEAYSIFSKYILEQFNLGIYPKILAYFFPDLLIEYYRLVPQFISDLLKYFSKFFTSDDPDIILSIFRSLTDKSSICPDLVFHELLPYLFIFFNESNHVIHVKTLKLFLTFPEFTFAERDQIFPFLMDLFFKTNNDKIILKIFQIFVKIFSIHPVDENSHFLQIFISHYPYSNISKIVTASALLLNLINPQCQSLNLFHFLLHPEVKQTLAVPSPLHLQPNLFPQRKMKAPPMIAPRFYMSFRFDKHPINAIIPSEQNHFLTLENNSMVRWFSYSQGIFEESKLKTICNSNECSVVSIESILSESKFLLGFNNGAIQLYDINIGVREATFECLLPNQIFQIRKLDTSFFSCSRRRNYIIN